jgi:hypothetical protein
MAAMPMRLIEVQSMGQDLAQRTVCVKVRLGRLGNTRKVSNSQVEVDTDKSLLLISKQLSHTPDPKRDALRGGMQIFNKLLHGVIAVDPN